MESNATVPGQLALRGLTRASLDSNEAEAGMASARAQLFKTRVGEMSPDEYRAQCVMQARVGLELLASAATGADGLGTAPFVYEPRTRAEISLLCSRLMELVQQAPLTRNCPIEWKYLPSVASSYM